MRETTTRALRLHGIHDLRVETLPLAPPGPGEVQVAVERGGICGSDLHYWHEGGVGTVRVIDPIVLGHEAGGRIMALGEGLGEDAGALAVGDRVAINPSHPCGACAYCLAGVPNQCAAMRFLGSAYRRPHEDGAFRDRINVAAANVVPLRRASAAAAACAEPLSVCLHAASRGPDLAGARVLVTGAGPIGALMAAVARRAGAAEVAVTDIVPEPLVVARRMGATRTLDVAAEPDALDADKADRGTFDVAFECAGAAPAIRTAIEAVRPRGTIVQVGVAGDVPVPLNLLVSKEIAWRGTHRFHAEFAEAARLIDAYGTDAGARGAGGTGAGATGAGGIDVAPIVTATVPLERAAEAFPLAMDRRANVKVQIAFEAG